jgi:hypothetical protein
VCSAIIVAFSLSVAFAGNERGNATKAMNTTNATNDQCNHQYNLCTNESDQYYQEYNLCAQENDQCN